MKNAMTDNSNAAAGSLKLLAMDTSTSSMSVALLEDGRVHKEIHSFAERNHSVYLIPLIMEALEELGWTPKDLQGIAVGKGPGSYTGVRIGVTVAKTMAWTLGLPVVGVSSLEAMAAGALMAHAAEQSQTGDGRDVWVVPMMNARRGQAFTALFEHRKGDPSPDGTPKAMAPVSEPDWARLQEDGIRLMEPWADELLERIRSMEGASPSEVLFVGEPGDFEAVIERFRRELASIGEGRILASAVPYHIQAEYIGYLGALRLAAGDADNTHGLLPNYTQLAEAEARLLGKCKK